MAGRRGRGGRDTYWERRLSDASSLEGTLYLLYGKLLADIKRLPEEQRDKARDLAVASLRDVLDEIEIHRMEERLAA